MLNGNLNGRQEQLKLVHLGHAGGEAANGRSEAVRRHLPHPLLLEATVPDHVIEIGIGLVPAFPIIHGRIELVDFKVFVHKTAGRFLRITTVVLAFDAVPADGDGARRDLLDFCQETQVIHCFHDRRLGLANELHDRRIVVAHDV